MKQIYLTLTLLITSIPPATAFNREKLLEELDQEVAQSGTYIKQKEAEVTRLKGNLSVASLPTDRYLSLKQIAGAYAKFDSDSALQYLNRCHKLGEQENNKEWMQDAVIQQAFIFADRGDNFTSTAKLETLGGINNVAPLLREKYAQAVLMRYLNLHNQMEQAKIQHIWDTYIPYIKPNSIFYYLFQIGVLGKYQPQALETPIRKLLAQARPYSYDDAMAHILLHHVYQKMGQEGAALEQLIRSAITDIRCANRSSSSLVTIIALLSKKDTGNKNVHRLLSYIKLSQEDISIYKDVGRSMQLLEAQRKINEDYIKQTQHQRKLSFIILAALITIGGVFLCLWIRCRKRLKHKQKICMERQEEIQRIESEDTLKLQTINDLEQQLAYTEKQKKETDVALVKLFSLLSEFIKDIKTYRKDMSRMLTAGMHREAKRLASQAIAKDRTADLLYAQFDDTFLSIHPDFIDRFNALLRPECRFTSENTHSLTPEQRIYALITLGVDESVNIAEILQYSTQTVYNYRLKVRKSTLEPHFKIAKCIKEMYSVPAS